MLHNAERAQAVMDRLGLDALIGTTWPHIFYMTGFEPAMETLKSDAKAHQMYSIITRDEPDKASLIVPTIDAFALASLPITKDLEVYTYGEYFVRVPTEASLGTLEKTAISYCKVIQEYTQGKHFNSIHALTAALRDKTLLGKKIGVDEMGLPPEQMDKLKNLGKIKRGYDALTEVRMVKTNEEIHRIETSTKITEEAYRDTLKSIEIGITEQEIADIYNNRIRDLGGKPALWLVGSGPEGALTDRAPSPRKLASGDLLLFDIGCKYLGYYSDTARSINIGPATTQKQAAYKACLAAEEAAIDLISPGTTPTEIFEAAVTAARSSGLPHYNRHHVGHGLGVYPYDPPSIRLGVNTPLEEDMIINIETPYYEMGLGGIQIEDTLQVTSSGKRYLTTLGKSLLELG